jgi:hypothetical protein
MKKHQVIRVVNTNSWFYYLIIGNANYAIIADDPV